MAFYYIKYIPYFRFKAKLSAFESYEVAREKIIDVLPSLIKHDELFLTMVYMGSSDLSLVNCWLQYANRNVVNDFDFTAQVRKWNGLLELHAKAKQL
jgi:hypothetical protein